MVLWVVFGAAVVVMLALDLGVFHRRSHVIRFREALAWTVAWIGTALLFMVVLYFRRGGQSAVEFATGYLVEWSLSVDNVFIFLLIFEYFQVPPAYQHKVLFWGIIGAVVIRAVMITVGVLLIHRVHWIVYVFGAFLIVAGLRMALQRGDVGIRAERNPVLKLLRRVLPVTKRYHGDRFTVRRGGIYVATPLLIVLAVMESTDVAFAVDSVPAVLAITTDPLIVFTSNVFAILGLRSLYFVLAGAMTRLRYLSYALAAILIFVGAKMVLSTVLEIPTLIALAMIVLLLVVSVVASLLTPAGDRTSAGQGPTGTS